MGLCNIYIYIYISEVKGSSSGLSDPLDREIDFDFDFDFDSFVRGGRGEAVCARVRRASLTLGLILVELCFSSRRVCEQ